MSGWIKMGTGLGSHPKVKTMRRALKADRLRVIGGLWAVWCVFDEHSASGRLDGYTLDDMDEEIGWKGFSAAMADIGWLIADDGGLEAPDYEQHNGPNAKRRALDASRKGQARAKGSADEPDEDPPEKRTPVRNVSASDADKTRNREEKRREELIHPEAKASAAAAAPLGLIAIETAEAKPLTAKDRVWALGVPLLGETARSHLGKLAKTYGEELLASVLADATMERPIDPKAWVTAACEKRKTERPANGHEPHDLLSDPKPDWALQAGFATRFEAENEGCTRSNSHKFRDGKRVV